MKAAGAGGDGVIRGRTARTVAGQKAMGKLAKRPEPAKAAPKAAPQKMSKVAPNAAKQSYKRASSAARAVGGDLRGASPAERRMANSRAAVVKNMERNRSTATPSAANSPKAAQKAREAARAKRAQSQYTAGMARESEGPGSKASRKVTVARRAMQIYAGKVDPKAKATARLTKTTDQEKLRARISRSAKLKQPKPAAKPRPAKPAAKAAPKARVDAADFQRRAVATEKRARAAEKVLGQLDRFNPANKKARNKAYALRNAADSYSSIVRRSKNNRDFTAAQIFNQRSRSTTAPKLSRSEKAARTRMANKAAKNEANRRAMERARRR